MSHNPEAAVGYEQTGLRDDLGGVGVADHDAACRGEHPEDARPMSANGT